MKLPTSTPNWTHYEYSKWDPRKLLKIMSEYDRFTTWVKLKRKCPDDELETTIHSIPIQYIRSIMKGVDEAAGRPRAPKKTDIDIAKAFLLKCYSMAPISPTVLDETSSYNFIGMSTEDIKKRITKSIKLNLTQIKATNILASSHVMRFWHGR
jgi:hypothetical protein